MEPKQLHAELHPFGENYHVNLNLHLSLKSLKWNFLFSTIKKKKIRNLTFPPKKILKRSYLSNI